MQQAQVIEANRARQFAIADECLSDAVNAVNAVRCGELDLETGVEILGETMVKLEYYGIESSKARQLFSLLCDAQA